MKADDKDKLATRRPTDDAAKQAGDNAFRPAIIVLPDNNGEVDSAWLGRMQSILPGRYLSSTRSTAGLEPLDCDFRRWSAVVAAAAELGAADGVLIIESGLRVPADLSQRLEALAQSPHCPPLTLFTGNHDAAANPFHGLECELTPEWCDDLAHLAGCRQWVAVDHRCPRLGFISPRPPKGIAERVERGEGWIYDGLFIHDPGRDLVSGHGRHPALAAALGPLRLACTRLTERDETTLDLPAIGRDTRPVTLHIAHHWGGGVARWIDDIVAGDEHGHHLVLAAHGHTDGKVHGQRLCLYAAGASRGLIGEWLLSPAIAATATAHEHYREMLEQIIARHGIGRVIVSSLIGHSLDALRTGLPTLQVLHDYYPAWPALDHDPLEFDRDDGIDLAGALVASGDKLLFERTDAAFWRELARHWQQSTVDNQIRLIAPTDQVRQRWCRLLGDELERIDIVPHGFAGLPDAPEIKPAPRADGRLNLVVVGRLSPGKGLGLLEKALPALREVAHVTLIGCGHHGMRLFGRAGVDILLDFRREQLPEILATARPQAALFLSTVAETWNYVLSETRSLGLVPIATRTGSFIERINDGHDGLLFDPDAESLVACLRQLHETPGQLTAMRAKLPEETGMATAIAACNERVEARLVAAPEPAVADVGTVQAMGRDGELATSRIETRQLEQRNKALYAELVERTAWARKNERLMHERTGMWQEALERIDQCQVTIEKQNHVIEDQANTIQEQAGIIEHNAHLARSLEEALRHSRAHAQDLQHNLDLVHASTSWRVTRPLRFLVRVASNCRAHRAWNPLRWPRLVGQFRHNLRVAGLRGALDRMQHLDTPAAPAPLPEMTPAQTEPATGPDPVSLPGTSAPRISIIIPVYNKYEYTAACLHSIGEHTPAGDWEVIVVDDCSSDDTPEYLSDCEGIRVIRNPENAGFIRSCNAGAKAARGEYLVFLNNDTTVTDGWLDALIGTFDQFEDVGIVGARLVYPDGLLQEAGGIVFNDASGWNYGRGDDAALPQYNFVSDADYVSGACLAVGKDDFETMGGFDTRFVPAYYEDTDLCFQVRALGKRVIYQPAATIVHHEGVSSGTEETSGTKRYQAINRDKFRDKWAEVLADHPPPEPDHQRADPVRHLRFRRAPKRVLLIDAVTPQPDHDSGSVRIMAMMTLLRDLGFQVSFMPENMAWVDRYSEDLQQAGIEVLYAPRIPSLERWLETHGRDLDLVIVSRHYVLAPLLAMLRRLCPNARLAFDTVDLHFLREEREAEVTGSDELAARAAETRRQELALIEQSDTTLVVSAVEQELLGELLPAADVRIVSNIHRVHGRKKGFEERKDLMFVGGFQHVPNIDAAKWLVEEIFPKVRQQIPDIRLHLIGSRMPAEILAIDSPGVRVHGFVPELKPYLEGCRLSVAPLRYGAGVKGKVNQAMSHGLPVVATTCAAEGMFLEHGRDVLIADDAGSFADCIVRAYNDVSLWQQLSDGALDNVERYFSMQAARRALIEAFQLES